MLKAIQPSNGFSDGGKRMVLTGLGLHALAWIRRVGDRCVHRGRVCTPSHPVSSVPFPPTALQARRRRSPLVWTVSCCALCGGSILPPPPSLPRAALGASAEGKLGEEGPHDNRDLVEEELGKDVQCVPHVYARFTQQVAAMDPAAVAAGASPKTVLTPVYALPPWSTAGASAGGSASAGGESGSSHTDSLYCLTPNFGLEGDVDVEVVLGAVGATQHLLRGKLEFSMFGACLLLLLSPAASLRGVYVGMGAGARSAGKSLLSVFCGGCLNALHCFI
jgi:hypothetical protein